MKNILFLENGTSGGGSFEVLFQCVAHLDKTRFRPVVVFVNKTVFYDRLRMLGISVCMIDDPVYTQTRKKQLWLRAWVRVLLYIKRLLPGSALIADRLLHRPTIRALCALIKQYKIDLVHLNNQSLRDLYGVIAASSMKVPCVSHLHSARITRITSSVKRFLNTQVAHFIANSRFTKWRWESVGLIPVNIALVYNAIGEAVVTPLALREEFGILPSIKYVIGCVGNLAEHKGQAFLIRAFQKVLQEEPNAALLIIGEGPSRPALEELIQKLDLSGSVILTGYDPRARQIIAGLDLLVLPSRSETFGMVLLEAMSTGVPMVAARVGGISEVISHEVNGLLVEYGDEQALASAMRRMLQEEMLQFRFITEGKRIVRENFNMERYIREIERIYDEIFSTRISTSTPKIHS